MSRHRRSSRETCRIFVVFRGLALDLSRCPHLFNIFHLSHPPQKARKIQLAQKVRKVQAVQLVLEELL